MNGADAEDNVTDSDPGAEREKTNTYDDSINDINNYRIPFVNIYFTISKLANRGCHTVSNFPSSHVFVL